MEPKLVEVNDDEGMLIGDSLDALLELARSYGVATEYALTLDPDQLDRTWAAWFATAPTGPAAAWVVHQFGVALGDWLVRRHNFVWKATEDESGRQLVVLGHPHTMTMYPVEVVAERFLAGETEFFTEISAQVEQIVARARR